MFARLCKLRSLLNDNLGNSSFKDLRPVMFCGNNTRQRNKHMRIDKFNVVFKDKNSRDIHREDVGRIQ